MSAMMTKAAGATRAWRPPVVGSGGGSSTTASVEPLARGARLPHGLACRGAVGARGTAARGVLAAVAEGRRSTARVAARAAGLWVAASTAGAELKAEIALKAGQKNGLDLSPEEKAKVGSLIEKLEELNPTPTPARAKLLGTNWELIYSSTTGASGGKVGPFIGRVTQVFDEADESVYINNVEVGLLRASLKAVMEVKGDDTLKVDFVQTTFAFGPFEYTKVFDEGRGGFWRMGYVDDDFRVLTANSGNVFVLRRV